VVGGILPIPCFQAIFGSNSLLNKELEQIMTKQKNQNQKTSDNYKIITHLKVFIPGYNPFSLKDARQWAENYYARIRHTSGARRKSIRTQAQAKQKVLDPLQKFYLEHLPVESDYVSVHGRDIQSIRYRILKNMGKKTGGKKYLKKIELAYQTVDGIPAKRIKDKLPLGAAEYAKEMTFGNWRLIGPEKPKGRNPLNIIQNWLTGGEITTTDLRKKRDELLSGAPLSLVKAKQPGRFIVKLRAQLMRSLSLISKANYGPEQIQEENTVLNQLITEFARPGFCPFSPGGASHIDFVIHPETAEFYFSPLLNEVRNKINRFFLGTEPDTYLDPAIAEGKNPADFIGRSGHPLVIDMHLDIQISA
jgi:hypothetical protein